MDITTMLSVCETSEMLSFESKMELYQVVTFTSNRRVAISWMIEASVQANLTAEARDTSIQIFDKFMANEHRSNPQYFSNAQKLSAIAASSLLLAAKLHDCKCQLSTASFLPKSAYLYVQSEQEILLSIDFCVFPTISPSCFLERMLDFYEDNRRKEELMNSANGLISQFFEEPEYLLFAPSTVAFSALLLSFLHLGLDFSAWVSSVTDTFFITHKTNLFERISKKHREQLLNVDKCLDCFRNVCVWPEESKPFSLATYEVIQSTEVVKEAPIDSPISVTHTWN